MKIRSAICFILVAFFSLYILTTNTFAVLPVGKLAKSSIDLIEHLKISVPHKGAIAVNKQINEKTCRDQNNKINRECYENKNKLRK